MGEAAFPHLDPFLSVADVDLAALQRVGMGTRRPPPRTSRNERTEEEMDHLIQLCVADAPPGDAPQVQLMGRTGVEAVDGIAPIGNAGAHQEDVVGRVVGEHGESRGDHGAGMAAEHVAVIDVAGVAGGTGDVCRRVPEPVVVVVQRDYPRAAFAADVALPRLRKLVDGNVDEHLNAMAARFGLGQVSQHQSVPELVRGQCVLHAVSSGERGDEATLSPLVNQRSYRDAAPAPWPEAG